MSEEQAVYQQLLEMIRQDEQLLQFEEFSNTTAYALGTKLAETARQLGKGITIDITRHGQQLFHCALEDTTPDNDEWIKRKIRVVNRFNHSSYYMNIYYLNQGTTFAEKTLLDPTEYAAHGGAFPIQIKNVGVVGTITVSGLPQAEDHALVVSVLKEFLGK